MRVPRADGHLPVMPSIDQSSKTVFGRCIAGPNPSEPGFLWRGNRRFFLLIIGTGQVAFLTCVGATVAGAAFFYA